MSSLTFALQALLSRHEAFMAEAEDERLKMSANIDRLENDKKELEVANARTIQANRDLLDQLEDMNNTLANSDAHIKSLSATLQSTRDELDRLAVIVGRTTQLESQLAAMELEQAALREDLVAKEDGQRTAVQRWKTAERTIIYLQEQVDRIEKEANDEQQRHVEVVDRMERRRAVEKDLETAAGRLKGAAAAATSTLGRDHGGSSVVPPFVKDILRDNANLQMGIVELREMLAGSNAEVENLREQMMLHQPTTETRELTTSATPLSTELTELALAEPRAEVPSELHVHHHYHPPTRAEKSTKGKSTNQHRRVRKQRNVITSGIFTPPSSTQTPRTPSNGPPAASASSNAAILSQTSMSILPPRHMSHSPPWTLQSPRTRSSITASSVPSSPQSMYRHSSLFDYTENSVDYSRPTSPESVFSEAPMLHLKHRKRGSDLSRRNLSTTMAPQSRPVSSSSTAGDVQIACEHPPERQQNLSDIDPSYFDHATILEEPEDEILPSLSLDLQESPTAHLPAQPFRSTLRRSASHESILSIKGPPITALRSHYSQLLRQPHKARTSISTSSPLIEPVISSMYASANSSLPSYRQDSSDYTRSILSGVSSHSNDGTENGKQTLGKRVGGWVWGKWSVAPMASTGNLRGKAAGGGSSEAEEKLRVAGVNQKGRVKGLQAPKRAASQVEVEGVDEGLLRESLGEE